MLSVCVDLDEVLAQYDGWKGILHIGDPYPGAVEFTKELYPLCRVVIYSTRCKEYLGDIPGPVVGAEPDRHDRHFLANVVRQWLDKHGFAYHEIYVGQGKPFACAYVDDRAVVCRPRDTQQWAFTVAMVGVKRLLAQAQNESVSPQLQKERES